MVSMDFVSSQMARLIDEVRQLRAVGDIDRANARSLNDNTVAAITRHVGALDAKLEIGLADIQHQLDRIEALMQQQLDRIETLLQPKA